MVRHVLTYGLIGGLLVTALRWSEYRFLVLDHSIEIYTGLVAATFAFLGIWLGPKFTRTRELIVTTEAQNFVPSQHLGLTPREQQVLELIAQGLSNREIAAKLFVSENTVKTHLSRVFEKIGAKRRTQAVQLGKQQGLLP